MSGKRRELTFTHRFPTFYGGLLMIQKLTWKLMLPVFTLAALFVFSAVLVAGTTQGDPKLGLVIYKKQCQRCHGESWKGDGPAGKFMKIKPADWTDRNRMSKLEDQYLTTLITKGGGSVGKSPLMPSFGDKLQAQDIQNLIALIKQVRGDK